MAQRQIPKVYSECEIEGVKYFVMSARKEGDRITVVLQDAKTTLAQRGIYPELDERGEPIPVNREAQPA